MYQTTTAIPQSQPPGQTFGKASVIEASSPVLDDAAGYEGSRFSIGRGLLRRLRRERRRRKVGRAYDMAAEIARVIPRGSEVLDVGCGNGYIAHHLSGLLDAPVRGIDLDATTEALIEYQRFDGTNFPVPDRSFDAVLLCYVLHHAQDLPAILSELRRTLRDGGLVVVYEDVPERAWDRLFCALHNRKWRSRTGPCTFLQAQDWGEVFNLGGFEILKTRQLSRWRNISHPVSRRLYVLQRAALENQRDA